MVYLHLHRLFSQLGIEQPITFLYQNGFTRHTARRLINHQTETIHFRHIEQLCRVLHCSIEDLFAWYPDPKKPLAPDHPLQKLRRGPVPGNITHRLQQLPPEQREQVRQFIDSLAQEPPDETQP